MVPLSSLRYLFGCPSNRPKPRSPPAKPSPIGLYALRNSSPPLFPSPVVDTKIHTYVQPPRSSANNFTQPTPPPLVPIRRRHTYRSAPKPPATAKFHCGAPLHRSIELNPTNHLNHHAHRESSNRPLQFSPRSLFLQPPLRVTPKFRPFTSLQLSRL